MYGIFVLISLSSTLCIYNYPYLFLFTIRDKYLINSYFLVICFLAHFTCCISIMSFHLFKGSFHFSDLFYKLCFYLGIIYNYFYGSQLVCVVKDGQQIPRFCNNF